MHRLSTLWTELCARTDYETCSRPRAARFRLDTIQGLMQRLGHPHAQLPAVHVAGSKGKGSVCHFLERGLRAAGLRTGLYTSPHLCDWRERILIHGEFADDASLARAIESVLAASDGEETFFDLLTAVAILTFVDQSCDVAVFETGLGGRYDSTNVLQPMAAVVTSIELEHVDVLGPDHESIAYEKGGIFKRGASFWAGRRLPASAEAMLEQLAAQQGGPLRRPQQQWPFEHPQPPMHDNLDLAISVLDSLPIPFCGAAETLAEFASSGQGLQLPGRWEARLAADGRRVYFDIAHSADSLQSVLTAFREAHPDSTRGICFALRDDKDPNELADALTRSLGPREAQEQWWCMPAGDHPRSAEPSRIAPCFGATPLAEPTLPDGPEVLLVTGSTYLVGALRDRTEPLP